jgi:hypothetical protein
MERFQVKDCCMKVRLLLLDFLVLSIQSHAGFISPFIQIIRAGLSLLFVQSLATLQIVLGAPKELFVHEQKSLSIQ